MENVITLTVLESVEDFRNRHIEVALATHHIQVSLEHLKPNARGAILAQLPELRRYLSHRVN